MSRYQFATYEFDSKSSELRREGILLSLEAQPAKILGLLLEKRGELVSKEELRVAIWGDDVHVDFDRGIAYCISQIRSALKDSGTNPRFVQTVPKQGYRIIPPVTLVDEQKVEASRRGWLKWGAGLAIASGAAFFALRLQKPLIVGVSIFDNETGRAELDPWVAGLSDAVVARLTPLAPTKVQIIGNAEPLRQPRNIRRLKEIARELKADYVVLGQLQNEGQGLRFVTHLIRLSDGIHLRANRIYWLQPGMAPREADVLAEYELMIRKHLLKTA